MFSLKLTTEYRGKFRHTFIHDDDFDRDIKYTLDELRKIEVGPGPYHQNRLELAHHNGIISPFYMGEYDEFLKTKEWRETRDDVMDILGPRCYVCKERKANHVHHETYKFGWLPFAFDMDCPKGWKTPTLIPICKTCHWFEHHPQFAW